MASSGLACLLVVAITSAAGRGGGRPKLNAPGALRCNVRVAAADEHRRDSLKLRLVKRDATRILSTYRVGHRAGYSVVSSRLRHCWPVS
jgi:hypothetical protein